MVQPVSGFGGFHQQQQQPAMLQPPKTTTDNPQSVSAHNDFFTNQFPMPVQKNIFGAPQPPATNLTPGAGGFVAQQPVPVPPMRPPLSAASFAGVPILRSGSGTSV